MEIYVLRSNAYGLHREAFVSWDRLSRERERLNAPYGSNYTDYSYYPVSLVLSDEEI